MRIKCFKIKIFIVLVMIFNLKGIAQVGIGTTNPQAALDISSTSQGLLAPRVALVYTTQELPVTNPQTGGLENGTIVYNTATVNDVTPGYYYWEDTRWQRLVNYPGFNTILVFTSYTLANPTGTNDDVDMELDGTNIDKNVFRIVQGGGAEIGGIIGGVHGRIIHLYNGNPDDDLKLLAFNNALGSAAINRFALEGDLVLKPGHATIFFYDGIYLNRWVVIQGN